MDREKLLAILLGAAAAGAITWAMARDRGDQGGQDGGADDDGDGVVGEAVAAAQGGKGADKTEELACPKCGTTTKASGDPFESRNQVNGHLRHCDGGNSGE